MLFVYICALIFANAKTNCKNGNFCEEKETCFGVIPKNGSFVAGRRYGCAPFSNATKCPDLRFSCPSDSKCQTSKQGSVCINKNIKQVTFEASANRDSQRYLQGNSSGICEVIDGELPSECNCRDSLYGAAVNCTVNIFNLDNVGMYADFSPCANPAHMGVMVYETKFGITYEVGEVQAGDSIYEPIPGLSVTIPGLSTGCGVYAVVALKGNLEELDVALGLDVCCMVDKHKLCGSNLSSELPIMFLSGNWTFANTCHPGDETVKIPLL